MKIMNEEMVINLFKEGTDEIFGFGDERSDDLYYCVEINDKLRVFFRIKCLDEICKKHKLKICILKSLNNLCCFAGTKADLGEFAEEVNLFYSQCHWAIVFYTYVDNQEEKFYAYRVDKNKYFIRDRYIKATTAEKAVRKYCNEVPWIKLNGLGFYDCYKIRE